MSITALPEKQKRRLSAPPKETQRKQETSIRLTVEEIERLTEPGHRARVSELNRELVLKILNADGSPQRGE